MVRRAIAAGAILIVLILIVIGVHSCQVSARNSSLKDYGDNVASLEQDSVSTGSQFFRQLSPSNGSLASPANLETQIDQTRLRAENTLTKAGKMNVPDEMKATQQNLLTALQMRRDGIANIGTEIQPALGTTTSKDAVNRISAEMARFYASDVIYKDYAVPLMIGALKSAGIAVGGTNGVPIEGAQFFPDIGWLNPTTVAQRLGARTSTASGGKPAPGTHGHSLDSVSVGGTTLQSGTTNTLPASPPPTFTFHFTNSGQNTEHNVILKITIGGTNLSAQTTVAQTAAGQSTTGQVALTSSPPAGTYTVTATVEPVPGEKNTTNNTQTYQVTFQ